MLTLWDSKSPRLEMVKNKKKHPPPKEVGAKHLPPKEVKATHLPPKEVRATQK